MNNSTGNFQSFIKSDYVSLVFSLVSIVIVTSGNGLLVVAIVKKKLLHTPTHILIVIVAASDFFTGSVGIPVHIVGQYFNKKYCTISFCATYLSTYISNIIVLMIAVERYVSILHPFSYERFVSVKKAAYVALGACLIPVFHLIYIPIFYTSLSGIAIWENTDGMQCLVTEVCPKIFCRIFFIETILIGTFIIVIYMKILVVVRRQLKAIATLEISCAETGTQVTQEQKANKKALQKTLFLGFLAFFLILSWLPYTIVAILDYEKVTIPGTVWYIVLLIAFSNPVVNPILYGIHQRVYLDAVKGLCRRNSPENQDIGLS
ncbi:unnamed protein product [Owenia fusiformis]|uniref:Uncharacterized protein n=1 Tax=Owenia fusiformis TaxID=6347 RepID=A0A8J1U1B1_OWEFU|nr:unnamed protein product [Owenia fusiformis]